MPDFGTLNYGAILGDLVALGDLARLVAKVLGFFLIGFGLFRLIRGAGRGGDSESQVFGGAGLSILCGAALLSIDTFMAVAGESLGVGRVMRSVGVIASEVAAVGPEQFSEAVRLAFGVAWIVGFMGMISGLNTLRMTGQNSQTGFAITKILGGTAAMNLPSIIKAMAGWGGVFSELAKIIK